ncbi:SusC/RagA family TonB-linked outer membrane protein [Chitinophaga tropicalis]|uniref:SusC/RagA family TonB-linked outer membrane protein n=1 Tax=Chitinophaga tropicalis TaxID=2683588 RepID=A0A7K1U343_9BACT|nr:SusC/RagA family TonB-linked outer membrane protein [Chitinophaga tropicalis]MVT08771.1 SusC/RagA family TonB-linked outer membrane protein [Chitinophaga tropicalis]
MKRKNIMFSCVLLVISVLISTGLAAQEKNDSLINVAFGTVAREDLLGGISTVNVSGLLKKSYGTYSLDNLQSFVGGYTGNIWGQEALVLVDGIPRRASDVRLVEIGSVTVLKGASAVVLYGSNAAKGVILITTKRGSIKPLSIDVRANTGLHFPRRYPGYLNAADYMTLYNEALGNDGISTSGAGYSQQEIDNTRAGTNPFRYPDIDFFSSGYLKKAYSRSDITTEISGGNERARYYTNIGLAYNNSIMNYGEQKKNNDFGFSIRGNVDMNLNSWLTASSDVAVNVSDNYAGRGDFWGASSTIAPNFNRFSPLIPISMFDPANKNLQTYVNNSNHVIDGKYLLGGQSTNLTNVFSDMLAAGYIKTKYRTFMYNMNAGADLGNIMKGLSFRTAFSMDYTAVYSEAYQLPYAVYRPAWSTVNGQDMITDLQKFNNDLNSTNETIGRTTYTQTMSSRAQFNYKRTFASDHHVTAALLGWWYLTQISSDPDNEGGSDYHPIRNTNLGFQAGYDYRRKYYLDFSAALVHSAKLPPGKRKAISPAVTLGWRLSDEDFFKKNISFIDNLKISASYASIKQDLDITGVRPNSSTPTDYYLYQGYYGNNSTLGGWYQWRDGAAGGWTTLSGQGDNPYLTFIQRQEYRTGIDASMFNRLITLEANYFLQDTKGLLTRGTTIYPSYFTGSGDFRPWLNFNNDRRSGADFSVNLNNKIGQVEYSIGACGMFFSSKATRRDEVQAEQYQYRTGRNLDAYWGYISEGFFQSQDDIDRHARQTFGGTVRPGDIRYKDINNDGIIDSRDQVDLGRNGWAAAPFTYGLNLTLKWKHFTLFAMGNGQAGAIAFKNSSYFWVRGAGKYSDVVKGRWTEATKNTATYPRLTTTAGNNNFQNSTFWMYRNSRFNLTRVQLTYDFDQHIFRNSFVHGLSIYLLGDNLLVISKERKLMETNIGTAPQYRYFNIGARASF